LAAALTHARGGEQQPSDGAVTDSPALTAESSQQADAATVETRSLSEPARSRYVDDGSTPSAPLLLDLITQTAPPFEDESVEGDDTALSVPP
jgi:hypothetical protein